MSNAQNALPSETILKETYHILVYMGEGGFSITYLAEDLTDGKIVVIKELYNSEYMERSASDGSVCIRDISHTDELKRDHNRFQNEWNMMETFKSYPGMVQPIDFFETNNTLYIVMEYLSGKTLKDFVRSNGPFRTGDFIEKISDVLDLIAVIHQNGYIHGDISPDNLVIDNKGIFRLIDFGAAEAIGSESPANSHIHKKGYSPLETGWKHYIPNQRWDIYSLCAVFYFALTGNAPEDSFERTLEEELIPPINLVSDMDKNISDMIMKGLSMKPENRWQSVSDIQNEFSNFTEREAKKADEIKLEEKRRKKKRFFFFSAAAVIAVALVMLFCQTHKELIKFKGRETQKIVVYYEENIKEETYQTLYNNMSQRAEHIAGKNNYLISEADGYVEITVPYELFRGTDIPSIIDKYFNFTSCTLRGYDGNNLQIGSAQLDSDNIITVSAQDDGCVIFLSEELSASIKKKVENDTRFSLEITCNDPRLDLWNANRSKSTNTYAMNVTFNKDDDQIFIDLNEFETSFTPKLLADCFTQRTIPIKRTNYNRHIKWEHKQQTKWGSHQVDSSQLRAETILLSYTGDGSPISRNILNYTVSEDEKENDTGIISLKKRLDSLSIPYACGWEESNENILYVAVNSKDMLEIEAALLFDYLNPDSENSGIRISSTSGIFLPDINTDISLKSDNDGDIHIYISDTGELENCLSRIKEKGDETVQLCLNNRPVFQTSLSNIHEDGEIIFDSFLLKSTNIIENFQNIDQLTEYINALIQHPVTYFYVYEFSDVLFTDHLQDPLWEKDIQNMHGCEISELRTDIDNYYLSQKIPVYWSSSSAQIIYYYDKESPRQYRHPFSIASDFLNKFTLTNELQNVEFRVAVHDPVRAWYTLTISSNKWYGVPEIEWHIEYFGADINSSNRDEFYKIESSNKESTIQFLSSENIFSDCYFLPALYTKYEKVISDTDDYSLRLSCQDTLPGQDYQFTLHIENKTSEEMEVKIDQININNVTPELLTDGYSISPQSRSEDTLDFSENDLHFPTTTPFKNIKMSLSINYGNQKIKEEVELQGTKNKE